MTDHGVYTTYTKGKCRCELCRAANRDYQRARNWGKASRYVPPRAGAPSKPKVIRTYGVSPTGIDYDAAIRAAAVSSVPYPESPNRGTRS